jgi:hypothetical protein
MHPESRAALLRVDMKDNGKPAEDAQGDWKTSAAIVWAAVLGHAVPRGRPWRGRSSPNSAQFNRVRDLAPDFGMTVKRGHYGSSGPCSATLEQKS